jgi:nitrogen fixation NifU-like protein
MYNEIVMKHFQKPRNMGEIKKPDAVGEVGNPVCGDVMKVTMKIDPKTKIIKDIKFKTFGCVSAIACSSITTDLVKGKTIDEARKIGKKEIADALGGLPPIKIHCSILSSDAIKKALDEYDNKINKSTKNNKK